MNGKQLKNSILQLAIQGKLVPQDPNDEPASVLLERIRGEKQRLVKEGKLKKKDLIETPITEDEIPFEIPDSWEWVRLGEITTYISRGKSPTYSEIKKYPIVAQKCNQWSGFSLEKAKFADPKTIDKYAEERILRDGDLLWNSTGLGTLGRMAIYNSNVNPYGWAAADSHVTVIRTKEDFCNYKYLYYYFASNEVQSVIEDKSEGSTKQKELYQDTVRKYEVPLPPLAEQKRIVAKIEELMPIVEKYGKAQVALDKLSAELPEALKKSILQEAIQGKLVPQDPNDEPASVLLERIRGEKHRLVKEGKLKKKDLIETPITEDEIPFDIPESWEWVRVKDIFIINPKVIAADDADAAFIPMEKIEACYGSKYSYEVRKWKNIKSSFTCFADGDVAFAKITPCFQNRKSMILDNLPNGIGAGTTELKVLRQYSETMERKYLLYFLASSYFVDEASFKGTANQQRIVVGYLENKLFPLPPLAEQKRIVAKIDEIFKKLI